MIWEWREKNRNQLDSVCVLCMCEWETGKMWWTHKQTYYELFSTPMAKIIVKMLTSNAQVPCAQIYMVERKWQSVHTGVYYALVKS